MMDTPSQGPELDAPGGDAPELGRGVGGSEHVHRNSNIAARRGFSVYGVDISGMGHIGVDRITGNIGNTRLSIPAPKIRNFRPSCSVLSPGGHTVFFYGEP